MKTLMEKILSVRNFHSCPARGAVLVMKSYLSALAVLLLVSTTPLPLLLRGFEMTGAPRFLLMVAQFLYRYLFVISEEAQHMRSAAASRGFSRRSGGFRAAAGALAVLFARSYARAGDIHNAMLARAFPGRFHTLGALRFRTADAAFDLIGRRTLVHADRCHQFRRNVFPQKAAAAIGAECRAAVQQTGDLG